jgi:hypothetical protein
MFRNISMFRHSIEFLSPLGLLRFEQNEEGDFRVHELVGHNWKMRKVVTIARQIKRGNKKQCRFLYDSFLNTSTESETK